MADLKKLLAAAGKNWKSAKKRVAEEPRKFGNDDWPDGRYVGRLTGATLGTSNAGNLQVLFTWKIQDGEYEGKTKNDYQGIGTDDGLFYLGRRIEDLGYEMPDNIEDLPEVLTAIAGEKPVCRLRFKTSQSGFQNVYIDKVLTKDDEEESEDVEAEDDETEVAEDADVEEDADEEETEEDAEEGDEDADEDADEEEEADEDAEEEPAEDEEDTVELELGMRVMADTAKGRKPGVVAGILEKENQVRVKLDGDGKVVRVSVDNIEIMDDDADVEEEPAAPPAKAKGAVPAKPASAPAKKPAPVPAKPAPGRKPAPVPVKTKGRR